MTVADIPESTKMEVTRTSRGFAVARSVDRYETPYSIQDSSLADEAAIWLGSDADTGGRAHLTQDMAAGLIPLLQRFVATGSIAGSGDAVAAQPEAAEPMVRITRNQYPEIIQAARWMDEDHGTPHWRPGVGFIVDDPEGLTVPSRWAKHLPTIEAALAGLDHERPHPQDADTLAALVRDGKEPTLYESAVHCFVSGEHTPVTIMAKSSRDLWIANRFLNERCESWTFDPGADFPAEALSTLSADAIRQGEGELRNAIRNDVVNTPETADFMAGVPLEAAHQRDRWGVDHDAGKAPLDWFWLIGYLAQKAADAAMRGDSEKARHHTISTAAALGNWHAALTGADTRMRPGIAIPASHASNGGEANG